MSRSLHRLVMLMFVFVVVALIAAWVRSSLTNLPLEGRFALGIVLAVAAIVTVVALCRELIAMSAKKVGR